MTSIELKVFRTKLETLQHELTGIASRGRESLAIDQSADDLDRLQSAGDRDYAIGNLMRNSSRLREVRDALTRVNMSEYGICVGCGEDLMPKRLAAAPWASSCVACQEREDQMQERPQTFLPESLPLAA